MNLLPKTPENFKSEEYWDAFFRKRKTAFEWYGEYVDLCEILHKYVKVTDKVLMLGCGNSKLSEDMYDVGYHSIENIDISDVVINQMKAKNSTRRPEMSYQRMDMLKMEFEPESFQVIIDKATLDTMFPTYEAESSKDVDTMFSEIHRVLKTAGRYICITLAQDHVLKKILESFSSGWFVRVHKVKTQFEEENKNGPKLPVFLCVFTKCITIAGKPAMKVFEVAMQEVDNIKRVETVEELKEKIKEIQHSAFVQNHLGKLHPGETFSFEVFTPVKEEPRFTFTVVDQQRSKAKNGKFAIFIVPQGREIEWLFSSTEGQQQVAASAGFERLVIVALSRGHEYSSIDAVKQELNGKVMEIAPHGLKKNVQVPYLSVGDDVGSRNVICEGESDFSGKYVIEDVAGDSGIFYRRLIFLSNKRIIQSEAKLISGIEPPKTKGKKKKKHKSTIPSIDFGFISNIYQTMVAGFSLVTNFTSEEKKDVLLVGLGGGSLAMFIHQHFPQVNLNTVEIDPAVVNISKEWFGFKEDDRLKYHVQDGKEFIQESADKGHKFDVIILDIDSKDSTRGLSGPPMEFIEVDFLMCVRKILKHGGVVILNLVCRESELRQQVLSNIQKVFPVVSIIDMEEEVNVIVYAQEHENSQEREDKIFSKNANLLEKQILNNITGDKNDIPKLCEILNSLQFMES